jgi:beta-N-acetylglucosaminidase
MKRSKLKIFLMIIFVFFCLTNNVEATSYVSLKDAVFIREGAGTNYKSYTLGQVATSYTLKNENIIPDEGKNGSCDAGWYEIDYLGKSGYVCSTYANKYTVEESEDNGIATEACEKEMQAAGFPSSYWSGLCSLKKAHPNWTFKAIQTNLDFVTSVNKFTNCGDALISNPKDEWRDYTCTNSEGSFKPVNQTAVAYYLDPRNFFNDIYIFQFEDNRYNVGLKANYPSLSKSIVNNTAFYSYHLGEGTDLSTIIANGGETTGVSPGHMAARMYQELGTGTYHKNLYQGTFYAEIPYAPINPATGNHIYDYRGYYNFYNINVTNYCVAGGGGGATYCGLNYAIARGWNSVDKAIAGGGEFLKSNYIDLGQYTTYFERFNVVPNDPSKMYVHYYMANLQAPTSESSTVYNSYKKANLLDSPFVFNIPVYKNMSSNINNSDNGAVDDNNSSSAPSTTSITTLLTGAGYKPSGDYLLGINPNTEIKTIIDNIKSVGGEVTITNKNNAPITTGIIGTGYKITVKNASETKTFTAVIKGDTSGDGIINAQDLLQIQKNILGNYNLQNEYKLAADTSGDSIINAQDLLQVQKNILGNYTIVQ